MFSGHKPVAGSPTAQIILAIASLVTLGVELYDLLTDDDPDEEDDS